MNVVIADSILQEFEGIVPPDPAVVAGDVVAQLSQVENSLGLWCRSEALLSLR
jgi:hypothetical protein